MKYPAAVSADKDFFVHAYRKTDAAAASINFYHPGGRTPPQRYLFKVTGSASIAGPAGLSIAGW